MRRQNIEGRTHGTLDSIKCGGSLPWLLGVNTRSIASPHWTEPTKLPIIHIAGLAEAALAPAAVFGVANTTALLGWLALVALPRGVRVRRVIAAGAVPLLLAAAYAALIGAGWSRAGGGFDSIEAVRELFTSDLALVAGWLHYLAFDLLIGVHIDERAERAGIGRFALIPAFALTFLFGPLGWLLYRVQERTTTSMRGVAAPEGDVPTDRGVLQLVVAAARQADRRLLAIAGALLALVPPTVIAALLDDRMLDGENVWLKPLKFELALAIYAATLAMMVPLAGARAAASGGARWLARLFAIGAGVEMSWIIFQAARGTRSHFNETTPIEGAMYSVMGVLAVVLVVAPLVLAPSAWRERTGGLRAGILAGLALNLLLGGTIGSMLAEPEYEFIGGAATPEGGLPFLGWLTTGGDLRIAHFLGLHALQAMVVAGIVASSWRPRTGTVAVLLFAAAWTAATGWIVALALRGVGVMA